MILLLLPVVMTETLLSLMLWYSVLMIVLTFHYSLHFHLSTLCVFIPIIPWPDYLTVYWWPIIVMTDWRDWLFIDWYSIVWLGIIVVTWKCIVHSTVTWQCHYLIFSSILYSENDTDGCIYSIDYSMKCCYFILYCVLKNGDRDIWLAVFWYYFVIDVLLLKWAFSDYYYCC